MKLDTDLNQKKLFFRSDSFSFTVHLQFSVFPSVSVLPVDTSSVYLVGLCQVTSRMIGVTHLYYRRSLPPPGHLWRHQTEDENICKIQMWTTGDTRPEGTGGCERRPNRVKTLKTNGPNV